MSDDLHESGEPRDINVRPHRVTVSYTAPVYVTVNLDTGDIERVFMDDTAVVVDEQEPLYAADAAEYPLDHTRFDPAVLSEITAQVMEIVDDVDWTSTDGRCQVWRGAEGGPRHMLSIVRSALMAHLDPNHEQIITMRAAPGSTVEFVSQGDFKAALRFLDDLATWDAEHDVPATPA